MSCPIKRSYDNRSILTCFAIAGSRFLLFNGKEVDLGVYVQKTSKGFMVPLRGVFERLGGKISTANGTKVMVKSGSKVLTVTRGSSNADINGQKFTLAEPVATIKGNTMVSVEAVTKLFPNVKVTSSAANKKINFTYGTASKPVSEPVSEKGLPARPAKTPCFSRFSTKRYSLHPRRLQTMLIILYFHI